MTTPESELSSRHAPGRLEVLHHGLVLLLLSLALWLNLRPWWIWLTAPDGSVVVGRTQIAGLIGGGAALVAFYLHLRWWWQGRWRSLGGATFRFLLFGLVCHWLIYLVWFQPFDPRSLWGTWTVGAGLFAALMALRYVLTERLPPKLLSAADLAAFYLCALVAGGELTLRTAAWIQPSVLLTHPDETAIQNLEAMRSPDHVRFGFATNSRGYYDEEPPEERDGPLVVTIGDSFSQGVVPHYYHYTTVAERVAEQGLPGIEIYNVGVAGVDLREYFHLVLAEALPLEPDLVVIGLFVGNDFTFHLPPPDPNFLGRWYSADRAMVFQVPTRIAALLEASKNSNPMNRKVLQGETEVGPVEQTPEALAAAFPWVDDALLEEPTFSDETFLAIERKRAAELMQPDGDFLARFQYLRKIVNACGDIPVLFLVLPDEFQVEDSLWSEMTSQGDSPSRYRAQDLLFPWLDAQGFVYLDPLPALRAAPPLDDGRLHVYRMNDTHLNVRGNRIVGEMLAREVMQLLGAS